MNFFGLANNNNNNDHKDGEYDHLNIFLVFRKYLHSKSKNDSKYFFYMLNEDHYPGVKLGVTVDYVAHLIRIVVCNATSRNPEDGDGFITLYPNNWEQFLLDNQFHKETVDYYNRNNMNAGVSVIEEIRPDIPTNILNRLKTYGGGRRCSVKKTRKNKKKNNKKSL